MVAICAFVFCLSFPSMYSVIPEYLLIHKLTYPAIWVKWWATYNESAPNQRLGYYLGIYALLGALALVSVVISCW
jgi:ATP-binding cassette subfamily C (CFTR/MRP) protein 1